MTSSPAIICTSDRYKSLEVFIVILLIFPVITFPILLGLLLYKFRNDLESKENVLPKGYFIGTIYESYKRTRFWWEPIALIRRTILVAFSVLIIDALFLSQAYCLLACATLMIQMIWKPFSTSQDNFLEEFCLLCILIISVLQAGLLNSRSFPVATQVLVSIFVLLPLLLTVWFYALLWKKKQTTKNSKGLRSSTIRESELVSRDIVTELADLKEKDKSEEEIKEV